jgi:hypothetical protein
MLELLDNLAGMICWTRSIKISHLEGGGAIKDFL